MPTAIDTNDRLDICLNSLENIKDNKVNSNRKGSDHSPTLSTNSNGPKTPYNELTDNNQFYDTVDSNKYMKQYPKLNYDKVSTNGAENDNKLMLENETNNTPNFAIPYARKPQRTSMETMIKLKVRYVARDLWQTITFQNTLTVAQVRDRCLFKCGLLQASELYVAEEGSDQQNGTYDDSESDTTLSNKDKTWKSEYALFWNAAGHWLDDFRRLNSYNLRALDVLELQIRNEFIFIQPSMYFEHYAEGYLYKLRNGINSNWSSRWFVLQGRTIWYFKKRRDPNPAGSADLSRPFQVQETSTNPNQSNGTESCLMLRFDDKCWWLKAFTPGDLDHWRRIFINLHKEANEDCAANNCEQPSTKISSQPTTNLQGESDDGSFNLNTSKTGSINSNSDNDSPGVMRIKAGFMFRRQPITHGFKERYFVLRGKELSCYKSDRFDKSNNPAKVIALHTVDVVAYINMDKYFFQIKDKQAADANFLQQGKAKKAGTDFKSIISSTKSLPMKVNNWIAQTNGSQLNTEYLYVAEREDWDNWRIALESIASLEIEIKDTKDLNKKELKSSSKTVTTTNTTSSFFSNKFAKSNKTKPTNKAVQLTHTNSTSSSTKTKSDASNRFSTFLKNRPNTGNQLKSSKNDLGDYSPSTGLDTDGKPKKYEDIDELTEQTPFTLSPKLIAPNLLLQPSANCNLDNPALTKLDKLLLGDSREQERVQHMRTGPSNLMFHPEPNLMNCSIDARSSCSTPSENIGLEYANGLKVKTSAKFLWFKRK